MYQTIACKLKSESQKCHILNCIWYIKMQIFFHPQEIGKVIQARVASFLKVCVYNCVCGGGGQFNLIKIPYFHYHFIACTDKSGKGGRGKSITFPFYLSQVTCKKKVSAANKKSEGRQPTHPRSSAKKLKLTHFSFISVSLLQ